MVNRPGSAGRRPWWRRSTAASLRWQFAVLVLLLLAGGLFRLLAAGELTSRFSAAVSDVRRAQEANHAILQALTDAETGVRGYQLTGDPDFLEPYHRGRRSLDAAQVELARHVDDDRTRRLLLREERAAQVWLSQFAEPLVTATTPAAAPDPGLSARGKRWFDEIRAANAAVTIELDARQAEVSRTFRTANLRLEVIVGLLVILGAGLAALIGVRTSRLLLQPLERLHATLQRMRAGDRSARMPPTGPPEVRSFIETFNALSDEADLLRAREQRRDALRLATLEVRARMRQARAATAVLDEAAAGIGAALRVDEVRLELATRDASTVRRGWPAAPPDAEAYGLSRPVATADAKPGADASTTDPQAPGSSVLTQASAGGTAAGWVAGTGAQAYLWTTFAAGGSGRGALAVICRHERDWLPDELAFVDAVSADLAGALEQADIYERQQQLVNQLRELDRQRTDFVNLVTHDLSNPLTSILSYAAEMAEPNPDEPPLSPGRRRAVSVIQRNGARLNQMVDELKDLARGRAPERELRPCRVPVAELAGVAVATLAAQAGSGGIALTADLPAELWVEVDPEQLERALINLLSNAVKYTGRGGAVRVTGRATPDGWVELTVTDTGIGIPAEDQRHLFAPFRRASNAGAVPGTGLGLVAVRAAVERHHGTVRLVSTLGVGTQVTIALPGAAPTTTQPADAGRRAPAAS